MLSLVLLTPAQPGRLPESPFAAASFTVSPAPERPVMASALALPAADVTGAADSHLRLPGRKRTARAPRPVVETMPLGPERARILLRSLTVPGWGQATLGRRRSAAVFGTAELGVWTAFASFRVQELLRRQGYERTARIFAGIDLAGRDDEYRRIVGAFASSDEYNLYVVARDAANLYMADPYHPDLVAYRAYIAEHSVGGSNGWNWQDRASFMRYREGRKNEQRASMRANTALGFAIANRLVSALHAMRASGHVAPAKPQGTSWRFDVTPGDPAEPTLFRAGLHASF
jgi:hypothetical protein